MCIFTAADLHAGMAYKSRLLIRVTVMLRSTLRHTNEYVLIDWLVVERAEPGMSHTRRSMAYTCMISQNRFQNHVHR